MQLFYCSDIISDSLCTLDQEESRHAVRVLRMREGDSMDVTDGRGSIYNCRVVTADDRACVVNVIGQKLSISNSQFSIHLAVAPTKNPARMEWLVEKAVEVGVGEITLLQCDHSERSFLKTDRLERIALSAMKQSLHTVLPEIHSAVNLKDWLTQIYKPASPLALKFIAHCDADSPRVPLTSVLQPGKDAVVLIGPEGDFSSEEIDLALECGFQPISLGPSRLRTETAALYAVTAFNIVNEK